jgi:hypothetical protein
VSSERRGDRVEVRVRDNGVGVKAADLPRLLTPGFTTKDAGEGTGLGLSICQTIVKSHGGEIRIDSAEGEWTQVTFDLPAAGTDPTPSAAVADATGVAAATNGAAARAVARRLEPVAVGAGGEGKGKGEGEGSDES